MFRVLALILTLLSGTASAQEGSRALARLEAGPSFVELSKKGGQIELWLSQPVPYRIFTIAEPRRLVIDFNELAWEGVKAQDLTRRPEALRMGLYQPGWSRMVLDLPAPLKVAQAGLRRHAGGAVLHLTLAAVTDQEFRANAGAPPHLQADRMQAQDVPVGADRYRGDRPLVVAIDAGHGGFDPGAQYSGISEADLTLRAARELREALVRGGIAAYLTRDADEFVPLAERLSKAREVGADVLISIHADAVEVGQASGTVIYTLSKEASNRASELLSEQHDRQDLLAGVDLQYQDDVIADVLMDMARLETAARTEGLAAALVAELKTAIGPLHKRPWLRADFSVLRAADFPAVLIEMGFMNNPADLANMNDPAWRARFAEGVLMALEVWAIEDAAKARLLRK
jgi:N-acetylmuramoyl-L-alanine amidase